MKETYFFFFSVATAVIRKLFIRVGQDHSRCLDGMLLFFVFSSFTSFTGHSGSFPWYFFHWAGLLFELCHILSEIYRRVFFRKMFTNPLLGYQHSSDFVLWIRRYYMYLQLYTLHHQPRCNYEWSADEVFSLAHNNSLVQVQVQVTVLQSWVIHPHMQTHANGQQMRIVQNTEITANSN